MRHVDKQWLASQYLNSPFRTPHCAFLGDGGGQVGVLRCPLPCGVAQQQDKETEGRAGNAENLPGADMD